MDAIRTAALAAVTEVPVEHEGQGRVMQATKVVHDRMGCDLRTAIDAVKWALDRPPAETLPPESVVAGEGAVFIKLGGTGESTMPWSGIAGHNGMYVNQYGDDEITDMLLRDEVKILRVGGGA